MAEHDVMNPWSFEGEPDPDKENRSWIPKASTTGTSRSSIVGRSPSNLKSHQAGNFNPLPQTLLPKYFEDLSSK